jgi:hypothetical protein
MALDAFDDFVESEVAVAAAATAALFSPRVRGLLRAGAVYGLAGLLTAGDTISSLARSTVRIARGAQHDSTTAVQGLQDITAPVRQRARKTRS